MGLGADHAFRARSTITDELGQSHVRYDHLYRGVRVWEGDTIVHKGPQGSRVTGDFMSDLHVSTVPAMNARAALAIAHQDLKPKGAYARNPTAELVIVPQVRDRLVAKPMRGADGEPSATDFERVIDGYTLAYYVHTELENGAAETAHTDFLVDAQSGKILKKWDALETAAANGTGISQYSGTVTIGTNSVGSSWEMRDVARGMNFATYNLNHGTSGTGTIYTDTDNTWGDGANYSGGSTTSANGQTAAVDAHYGVAMTYDYYKNVHNRNGIDGAGASTYSRVHYSSSYDNAFWSDSCFCMTYGDGSYFKSLNSLDVAGHEMSHGVTSRTANLTYSGESGGLNESISDIGGTMVEFYARGGSGSTIGNTGGNWLIGEQLNSTPLRYMYKPSKDGTSPDAWYSGIGSIDVHYSSGPFNRFFYFLSQGASSSSSSDYYSSYLPAGMTGIGNDHAARIVFRALTVYMTSSTNYAAARTACLNAATDLYGGSSADYTAVQNAMAAINVGSGGGGGTVTTLQDGVPLGSQSGSTGADAFYKISVPSGQTSLVVTTTGGSGDADLYVKFGSQPTTSSYDCASTGSTTAETCTISNPSTGYYYITLHAYSTYSGVTITADYSTGGGGGGDTVLTDGVPLSNQSGASGADAFYKITVPASQTSLVVTISGGTGDADMYVKFGAHPTSSSYDCRPYLSGNNETCTISNPSAGDWYIMLHGYSAYSGVTLLADYSAGGGGGDPYLTNGVPVTGISGASGSQQYWRLAVPSGKSSVVFTISGGSGDCDLYVRSGSRPTTTTYNCRPYLTGNNETCTISNPAAGDWYVMLRGYTSYSGVTLKGQY